MTTWRDFEGEAAELFRGLGCDVEVDAPVVGARATHKIDVWVQFQRFGLAAKWVIECKCWNKSVPKEKVLALKSIVDDVGADRGVLISRRGFQSGAVAASKSTNITLVGMDQLREIAASDLLASAIHRLEERSIGIRKLLQGLQVCERKGPHKMTVGALPGVNGRIVMRVLGKLSFLRDGLERARIAHPPYAVPACGDGDASISTDDIGEFVRLASDVLAEARAVLDAQRVAARRADVLPNDG